MPDPIEPSSPGARFRLAVAQEKPLQVAGAVNAYTARLAQATGYRALYLSGGGVAANSLGIPDLGISTMEDVLTDLRRITDAVQLPLLVDIDTGFGGAFNIARTIRSMINAGAGRVPHRRPGQRQALRPPPRQGDRPHRGDGRSHQGRGRCPHRRQLRHHGPHRRPCQAKD